jgi:hypothetical protein
MTNSDVPDAGASDTRASDTGASNTDAPAEAAEALVGEADERRESQEEPVEGSKLVEGTDDDVEFAN